jgi:hypothetical protein
MFNQIEVKVLLLYMNMELEVIKVIKPFLELLRFFYEGQTHNRVAIMLDPHFKALRIVENLVGHKNAIQLAFEYDVKVGSFFNGVF